MDGRRRVSAGGFRRVRLVAGALCHVSGAEAFAEGSGGWSRRIAADAKPPDVTAGDLRLSVIEALHQRSLNPVRTLLDPPSPDLDVRLRAGDDDLLALDRGARWRRTCTCGTTDYLLTELDEQRALRVSRTALELTPGDPVHRLWFRPDEELGLVVVAVEWPPLAGRDELVFDQALRDLVVMSKISASLRDD